MPEVVVEVEVYCAKCGAGLCNQTESVKTHARQQQSFRVTPCEACLKKDHEEGHSEGYDEGYDQGHEDGQSETLSDKEQQS